MKGNGIQFTFTGQVWKYDDPNGWYFISLPKANTNEIRTHLKWLEEGWGRLKVTAKIETCTWQTAIWYDSKLETYLLPIKAEIRKKLDIEIGKKSEIHIWI